MNTITNRSQAFSEIIAKSQLENVIVTFILIPVKIL